MNFMQCWLMLVLCKKSILEQIALDFWPLCLSHCVAHIATINYKWCKIETSAFSKQKLFSVFTKKIDSPSSAWMVRQQEDVFVVLVCESIEKRTFAAQVKRCFCVGKITLAKCQTPKTLRLIHFAQIVFLSLPLQKFTFFSLSLYLRLQK